MTFAIPREATAGDLEAPESPPKARLSASGSLMAQRLSPRHVGRRRRTSDFSIGQKNSRMYDSSVEPKSSSQILQITEKPKKPHIHEPAHVRRYAHGANVDIDRTAADTAVRQSPRPSRLVTRSGSLSSDAPTSWRSDEAVDGISVDTGEISIEEGGKKYTRERKEEQDRACAQLLARAILSAEVEVMSEFVEGMGERPGACNTCRSTRLSSCDINRQIAEYLPTARERLSAVLELLGQW